jgi:hypothetical protein
MKEVNTMNAEPDCEKWITDDLALATFLHMEHEIMGLEWREPSDCFFIFELTDDLMDDAATFSGGLASVDPREFMRIYGALKRKMTASRPREMDPRSRRPVRHV